MSQSPESAGSRFFVSLESLRGIAALVVVIYHAEWLNPITRLRFFQNGALMVDLFFVLSGFVIYHSYGARLTSARDVARFLWLRVGRLYPLHLTFLLVFLGIEVLKRVGHHEAFTHNNGYSFVTNLLLLQSLGLHKTPTYNYPSWSISTEFYNYVLFAIVCALTRTVRRLTVAAILIVAASIATLLALGVVSLQDAGFDFGFFRCAFGFFTGVLACEVYFSVRNSRSYVSNSPLYRPLPLAALAAVTALLLFDDPEGRYTYAMPLLSAVVIVSLVLWPPSLTTRILCARPLQWLGRVSYSVYMTHAAVVWVVKSLLESVLKVPRTAMLGDVHIYGTSAGLGLLLLIAYVMGVLLLSHFTFNWIEAPFRNASRRLAAQWFTTQSVKVALDRSMPAPWPPRSPAGRVAESTPRPP